MEQEINTLNKESDQNHRGAWLILFGSLLMVTIVTAGIFYFSRDTHDTKRTGSFEALIKDNEEFIRAEAFLKNDQWDLAEEHYRKALLLARNADEEGQIFYKIAVMKTRRDPIGAISILKEIVANQDYSDRQKAYAVQHMGEIFRKNSSHEITSTIFTGEPYADFFKEGDADNAYRRLYEYAASFYPLALSEVRAAHWYSNKILQLSERKSLSEEEKKFISDSTVRIRFSLEAADQDIERTKNLPNAGALVPVALAIKAIVLADMFEAGDASFPDPESAFKSAMEMGLIWKDDSASRFNYAAFLARKGDESRKKDIIDLLDDFYTKPDIYAGRALMLTRERDNILGAKNNVILLAKIDPAFKSFLLTLGWKVSDFGS